jgi:hypothetical protein
MEARARMDREKGGTGVEGTGGRQEKREREVGTYLVVNEGERGGVGEEGGGKRRRVRSKEELLYDKAVVAITSLP